MTPNSITSRLDQAEAAAKQSTASTTVNMYAVRVLQSLAALNTTAEELVHTVAQLWRAV